MSSAPDLEEARRRLVLPLDVPDLSTARSLIARLRDEVGVFKVGLELFTAEGPNAVRAVLDAERECFLDLKLHDIPKTMARAVESAVHLGAHYLTVHAASGADALMSAARAAHGGATRLLAVTVLTSLDGMALQAIGLPPDPAGMVLKLAQLAGNSGIDGLVCSPHECASLRVALGESPLLVVPGIRPEGSAADDQRRAATPGRAISEGADLLVVGRPIREAAHPIEAARAITSEIAHALARREG